jgi:3-hydroxybutyryl-CoA dehydratase
MEQVLTRDFDRLTVGDGFTSAGRTVTEADVVAFASVTGDRHPQHVDRHWAVSSVFGERIAHGMLVLSYAVGLVDLDPDRVVGLRSVREAIFKRPVRLGDTIHVEGRIEDLTPLDAELGLVATRWRIVNQDGATAARVTLEVLWRRSAAAPRADALDGDARTVCVPL